MNLEKREDELQILDFATRLLRFADERNVHLTDHGPGHLERVSHYGALLGSLYDLNDYETRLLRAGCLVHDIGMIEKREYHERRSSSILKQAHQHGDLDFDRDFLDCLSYLVAHHTGPTPSRSFRPTKGHKCRHDLVLSLLRIADALDTDYRRASDLNDTTLKLAIKRVDPESELHHNSLGGVAGVRVYFHRVPAIEVFLSDPNAGGVQIAFLEQWIHNANLTIPVMAVNVRKETTEVVPFHFPEGRLKKVLIVSYFNAQGVINAGITMATMKRQNTKTRVICSPNKTGELDDFWNSNRLYSELAKAKSNKKPYDGVLFVGMPFTERSKQTVIKRLEELIKKYGVYVFYGTYFPSVYSHLSDLCALGVRVGIGDARTAFFGISITDRDVEWMKVCAYIDRSPSVYSANTKMRELEQCALGFEYKVATCWDDRKRAEKLSRELLRSVAEGSCHQYRKYSNESYRWRIKQGTQLEYHLEGKVIVVENFHNVRGRNLYPILDGIIEKKGFHYASQYVPRFPYAIASRSYGKNAHVLLQTYRHCRAFPALWYFLPESIKSKSVVGDKTACWVQFKSLNEAQVAVKAIIDNANEYCSKQL